MKREPQRCAFRENCYPACKMQDAEGRARILVVDDEDAIRELIVSILTSAGYQVASAPNGRAAVQRLAESPFHAVITDLVMPEQEGIETIQMLRREYPDVKVIAVSGAFGGQCLRVAQLLGAHSTLQKPFEAKALLATVRDTLSAA